MQDYLNHIFAHAAMPPPDAEDLRFEVRDLLRHEEYAQKVFISIQRESCPYRREGLLECFRRELKASGMLKNGDLYMEDNNGYHYLVWQEAEREIKNAIRACEEDTCNLEDVPLQLSEQHEVPTERATISTVVQQAKDSVKQAFKDIVKDIPTAQVANIHIQQLTIPIHIYNAPIGQYTHHIEQQEIKH